MRFSRLPAAVMAVAAVLSTPCTAGARTSDGHIQLAQLGAQSVPFSSLVRHRPPIGPGRSCEGENLRDPYTALICTDDRLAEAWLMLMQADLALGFQASETHRRFQLAIPTTSGELAALCPFPANAVIVTDAMRAEAVPCIRRQILRDRAGRLAKLSRDALEEANREIHAHIAAQKGLIDLGLLHGRADGVYGLTTRTAIKQLQVQRNVPPSGFMTNATVEAIKEKLAEAAGAPPSAPTVPAPPPAVPPAPQVPPAPEVPPAPPVSAAPETPPPPQLPAAAPRDARPQGADEPPAPAADPGKAAEARAKRAADAAALKTQIDAGIVAMFKPAQPDQDASANWVYRGFPDLARESVSRLADGWEYVSAFSSVADLGLADWNGQGLTTVIVQSYIRLKNDKAGQYSNLCYDFAVQSETDIARIRQTRSFSCTQAGSPALKAWLAAQNFTSDGKAR